MPSSGASQLAINPEPSPRVGSDRTSIEKIWRLSLRDPLIRQHISAWQAGAFATWEECLQTMVVNLAEHSNALNKMLGDLQMRQIQKLPKVAE